MPLLECLHHVAVIVKDVDKAKVFYEGVFELKPIVRLTKSVSHNRGEWYQLGENQIHLQERPDDSLERTEQHYALVTSDFNEVCKRVVKFGGRLEEGKLIEGFRYRGFLFDIDGNRIELLQK